jgi:hypothetical protein
MASAAAIPELIPLPISGRSGSRRGHVWVASATLALRCEGLDPRYPTPRHAPGHTDIDRGERFLRKIWRVGRSQKPAWYVTSVHCLACARTIEAELGVVAIADDVDAPRRRTASGRGGLGSSDESGGAGRRLPKSR